jgi:acetyltransferase-like isoleucine patch superfamily enzyme
MIHSTSVIEPGVVLEENVEVGPFTIIRTGTHIGEGTRIGSNCDLGVASENSLSNKLYIGKDSIIRSHTVLYTGSNFGSSFTTGHHVTVRENTTAGINFQIGTFGDIQGDCSIGNYVRLHSNVHVGKKSSIADFVWLFPYVVLTNDPHPPSNTLEGATIGKFSVVATMSTILPGIQIGEGALIGAHTLVSKNVPDEWIIAGVPGRKIGHVSRIKLKDGSGRAAYPWRFHFSRGYPESVVQSWIDESKLMNEGL